MGKEILRQYLKNIWEQNAPWALLIWNLLLTWGLFVVAWQVFVSGK